MSVFGSKVARNIRIFKCFGPPMSSQTLQYHKNGKITNMKTNCLVARVSTGSAVQQQCSSAADKGWRFVPRCHLAWASEGTPVGPGKDTPSTLEPELQEGCGWPVWVRQQTHGKHGSGAQVVNVTERLVAGVEQGTTGDVQRSAAQSGLGRPRAVDTSRRPTMNVSEAI